MSSDPKLSEPQSNDQEDSTCAETTEPKPARGKGFCDICKVHVSEKNMESHTNGRKHQLKVKGKGLKKNKNSSNSDRLTERMDIDGNNSFSVPTDKHCSKDPETNYDASDRKPQSNDYEVSDRRKNHCNDHEISDRKKSHYNDYDISHRRKKYYNDYEMSERRKGHSKDYRINNVKSVSPSYNYYSPNRRETYHNKRNYHDRNYHWNTWSPNPDFVDGQNMRFHSFNDYDGYDQNYHFNNSPGRGNGTSPILPFNNWVDMPNPADKDFFSENVQSENIQPVESYTNFETLPDNKKCDKIVKPSTDEQKSPIRKTTIVLDNKAKRSSPRISIKDIIKATEDVQNQSGGEKQLKDNIVLSENKTGKRLAHWINPSNQKDQAEIRRLVTELTKSKKKENLIKLKLHTDKVAANKEDNQNPAEETSLALAPEVPVSENTPQLSSALSNTLASNITESNKRQRSSSFTEFASNVPSPVAHSPSTRNRSESLTLDGNTKNPLSRHTKRLSSNPCESPSTRKRKESVESGNASKKHKCSSAECLEKCIESAITNADVLSNPERTGSVENSQLAVNTVSKEFLSPNGVYIKKEIVEELDGTEITSSNLNELIQKQTDVIASCQDDASLTPVESLINLFATGNIAIKKEFDDPLIDAIRSIDPVLLDKVCENETEKNKKAVEMPNTSQENVEKLTEPITAPTPVISESFSIASSNSAPSLTISLKNILDQLQIISEEEEKVKINVEKADQQIQFYQTLLDKWKTKKMKFQSEEEILRNKRNTLVKTMNDLVVQQSSECRSLTESSGPEERPPSNSLQSSTVINNSTDLIKSEIISDESVHIENISSTSNEQDKAKDAIAIDSEEDVVPLENDEVVILPAPESRIPVIDLDHIASPSKSNGTDISSKKSSNTDIISGNCHKFRDLVAHNGVVNSIQILDDYIYTCANDKTAKRFSLKDPTEVVTYSLAEKNIVHLCVEKIRGKTYVFTCASNSNLVTVFDAESGLKVKVHQFRSNIANICKGKYKIYVGLKNGYIFTCDWKDQKELVYNEEPLRSIAIAYQGGINILVALSTKGNVSVRDADRNGLLIKYVKALAHVPLFMSIYHDWVYLSSAGYLSVLDLSSGTFVKKYELPAAYTSLTVYKDHIFTTSFSGFVRCYSKYDIKDMKAYYGAGKVALTCIYAHDGWVFTGNRTGVISLFKFDPEASLPCQLKKCSMVFARLDDLMYHALQGKDHNLTGMKTCQWQKCKTSIKRFWDPEAVQKHIRAHIAALFPSLHEPMYNLTV